MQAKTPQLWLKIVIPSAGAIGPGKIDLLRAVDREGSIAAAARALGMSYRRAWTLIDETRRIVGTDVVATRTGGSRQGGASLTQEGHALVRAYERIARKAGDTVSEDLAQLDFTGKRK